MKIKIAVWLLVFGYSIDFVGAWMKVTHQAPADFVLVLGAFLKIIGLLLLTAFLLAHPKVKEFLNSNKFDDSFK